MAGESTPLRSSSDRGTSDWLGRHSEAYSARPSFFDPRVSSAGAGSGGKASAYSVTCA